MNNKALRWVGFGLMILSLAFVVYKIVNLDLSSVAVDFSFGGTAFLIIALVFQTLSVLFLGMLFKRNVSYGSKGKNIPLKRAVYEYCRSNLGKYIPGNVFQYVERNLFFSTYGIPHIDSVIASLMEVICLVLGGIGICAATEQFPVIINVLSDHSYMLIVFLVLVVIFIVIAIVLIRAKKNRIRDVFVRITDRGLHIIITSNFIAYAAILVLMGIVTILSSFGIAGFELSLNEAISLFGAYITAWICGFIIVGAPGGIGVREAVFMLIYRDDPKLGSILALSILVRVISVLADILAFVVSWAVCGRKNKTGIDS